MSRRRSLHENLENLIIVHRFLLIIYFLKQFCFEISILFSVFYKTSLIEYFLLFLYFYFIFMDNPLLFLIGIAIIKLEIINYDLLSETFSYLTVPHARRAISLYPSFMNDCFNDPLTFSWMFYIFRVLRIDCGELLV